MFVLFCFSQRKVLSVNCDIDNEEFYRYIIYTNTTMEYLNTSIYFGRIGGNEY